MQRKLVEIKEQYKNLIKTYSYLGFTPEIIADMQAKKIDVEGVLKTIIKANAGIFNEYAPLFAKGIPQEVEEIYNPDFSFKIQLIEAQKRIRALGLPYAIDLLNIGSYDINKGTISFDSRQLGLLGSLLQPILADGVFNGGSASSYWDVNKNAKSYPEIFAKYEPYFTKIAEALKGKPKGITPAYINPDGKSVGYDFFPLKMRSNLIKILKWIVLTGKKPERNIGIMFQMTSDASHQTVLDYVNQQKDTPLLKDLLEVTGSDMAETLADYSKQQRLLAGLDFKNISVQKGNIKYTLKLVAKSKDPFKDCYELDIIDTKTGGLLKQTYYINLKDTSFTEHPYEENVNIKNNTLNIIALNNLPKNIRDIYFELRGMMETSPYTLFTTANGQENNTIPMPGGHGDCFFTLKEIFIRLKKEGKKYITLKNTDNLGNYVSSQELALMALMGKKAGFDFATRTIVDQKCGVAIIDQNGNVNCGDIDVAISRAEVEEFEKQPGVKVLANVAAGIFELEWLIENIENVIKGLPVRVSKQEKDPGLYWQAEQITWEILGLIKNSDKLIFAVPKQHRFLAAKTITELLLSCDIDGLDADALPDKYRDTVKLLQGGLENLLSHVYGLKIVNEKWEPKSLEELFDFVIQDIIKAGGNPAITSYAQFIRLMNTEAKPALNLANANEQNDENSDNHKKETGKIVGYKGKGQDI